MNKKGQVFVIIFIVFIILIIAMIFIFSLKYKQPKDTDDNFESSITKFLLNAVDFKTNEQIPSNFVIGYYIENPEIPEKRSFVKIQEGILSKDVYTEINYPLNTTIYFYAFSDNYYTEFTSYNPILIPQETDLPLLTVKLHKIGVPKIIINENLTKPVSNIRIQLDSKEQYRRINLCYSWSVGISYFETPRQVSYCNTNWLNYSHCNPLYYNKKLDLCRQYIYYDEEMYRCSITNEIRKCDDVKGIECTLPKERDLIIKDAFTCMETGKTLDNSGEVFDLKIISNDLLCKDNFKIFAVDEDLRLVNDRWINIPTKNIVTYELRPYNC